MVRLVGGCIKDAKDWLCSARSNSRVLVGFEYSAALARSGRCKKTKPDP